MDQLDTLVSIAADLTSALSSEARYTRLLATLRRVIPYDASVLLRLEGDDLIPVVANGLRPEAMGRRFPRREQPRLDVICRAPGPVLFAADSELPDPFDGLIDEQHMDLGRVHACLGCPLRIGDELIGALTADAARPHAFDRIDRRFLAAVGSLAAAEMGTTHLIEALEHSARRQGWIARDLMRDAQLRRGSELIGSTTAMRRLRQDIDTVAHSQFNVLITGETGTGKELVARAIHGASARSAEPMLYVNCAALPETLADSELFGHLRGAFTGATADRPGKFEVANGGTLFLDEVGELPLSVQPKLLRALQEGEIQRVGSDRVIRADVRVIAATNRDLEQAVSARKFRSDLFHRLNVYPVEVPPLRERSDDIALLVGHFCDRMRRQLGLGPVRLEGSALTALRAYAWPGNVRELENVLSRGVLKAAAPRPRKGEVILALEHLGPDFSLPPATTLPAIDPSDAAQVGTEVADLKAATRQFQRDLIRDALVTHGGNWAAAARSLGMHRSNFHHLARRLELK